MAIGSICAIAGDRTAGSGQSNTTGGKIAFKKRFNVLQVIAPGQALANEVVVYNLGTQTEVSAAVFLLSGVPDTLVDDDSWSGWVNDGGTYEYTTVQGGSKTVRRYVVSTNQNPRNAKVERRAISVNGETRILDVISALPEAVSPSTPSVFMPPVAGPTIQGTFKLIALNAVQVTVRCKNADGSDGDVVFQGGLVHDQTQTVAYPGPIYITADLGENLQIEYNGKRYPSGFTGANRTQM